MSPSTVNDAAGLLASRFADQAVGWANITVGALVTLGESTRSGEIVLSDELESLLRPVGLQADDCGGSVSFTGTDPIVNSVVPVGALGALAMAARQIAASALWCDRTGDGQDIQLDLRSVVHSVSPFWQNNLATLNGYQVRDDDPFNPFNLDFYATADDRHVCLLNPTPILRERAARLLGCRTNRRDVVRAVGEWNGSELERAAQAAGVACIAVRSPAQWRAEPQRDILAELPVISLRKIGDSAPEPVTGARPLSSVRALGIAHQIAGAQIGSGLAEHGADVLNLWQPGTAESFPAYVMSSLGVRSAILDADSPDGRACLHELAGSADVIYSNRRVGRLANLGMSALECAARRPGIVHVTVSAFGESGPWADWGGFDPHASSATGLSVLEGRGSGPKLPGSVILNDFVVGWLGATGAMAGLRRRAAEGGSWQVQVSLSRSSMWFQDLGLIPDAAVMQPALEPRWVTDQTALGVLRTVAPQVHMTRTPPRFDTPILTPRGSSQAEWRRASAR